MTHTTTGRRHPFFHHMLTGATLAMLLPLPLAAAAERATRVTDQTTAIVLQHGLLIDGVGQYGRSPVHRDVVEQALLAGTWQAPRAGATLESADGTQRTWRTIEADEHGWFSDRQHRGGYVAISIESDAPRIMLLHMMGNSMAYVNGVPRIGSRYQSKDRGDAWEPSFDYVRLPVHLREGRNDLLLMRAWRSSGRVKAELVKPAAPVILNRDDLTVPDLIVGRPVDTVGAVVLINATDSAQTDLRIKVIWQDQQESIAPVPIIQPMSVRKVAFPLVRKGTLPTEPGTRMVQLQVVRRNEGETDVLDRSQVRLQVVGQGQPYRTTFVSRIDESVQYYAVNPMYPLPAVKRAPALVLSVHGAGVEAINQARAYAAKSWCHIVAPTNRRPYGFDWEDWGRRDALEVLQHAGAALGHDPTRTYLTGHSMGGHGTWILGATLPDRFAAIAPSAGWLSFWSYRGAKKPQHPTPVEEILLRPEWASDTLVLAENLKATAVYILHGGADDNVPPTESRRMVARLKGFHKDFVYHEEPGQGHWWDLSDEPGADCVDWPALFDFLARHTLPSDNAVREIDFMTANPGINDRSHWVGVEDQEQHLNVSRVHLRVDPGQRRFVGTTDNVARLRLALDMLTGGKPLRVELDGQTIADIPWPTDAKLLWLAKRKGQ
jgi:pimeloyl-ACP methyl ester carboxylesterase